MADDKTAALPEGTDTVIARASQSDDGDTLTMEDTALSTDSSDRGLANRLREGREQLSSQAGERARGFVTQGMERTAEALANVSKMVGDTAPGIDER